MIRAIIIAMMKLIPFLRRAIFFPSSFISKGSVTIPIIVNVVMKTASAVIDAPLSSSDAARGNEIRAGICESAPNNATRRTPPNPDCLPIISEISLGGTKPKRKPMKIMMIRTVGRTRRNDFTATNNDCFVFALSIKKETIRQQTAKMFIKTTVEFTFDLPPIIIPPPELGFYSVANSQRIVC